MEVTRIELKPISPVTRVHTAALGQGTSLEVYKSDEANANYVKIDGWKLIAKEKGGLEIVFEKPQPARCLKVKSLFDDRDADFNPVLEKAEFKNLPDELIRVFYLVFERIEVYTYDDLGNRTVETITQRYPVSRNYTYYDYSSRLKSNGKYNFEYDANGNLTKKTMLTGDKAVWNYEYDLLNRLVSVTKDGVQVASYIYDESGLRLKKQGANGTVYYVFDTAGNVLYQEEGREYTENIYVLGKHFARVDGNLDTGTRTKYFYHTDHLGSTVVVTNESGETVWSTEYCPFGKTAAVEGELKNAAKFTGKDLDEDTGLYYFNARWYDQEVGRFISEDQVYDPNSPNLYTYCANNPLTNIDPSGNTIVDDAINYVKGLFGWNNGNRGNSNETRSNTNSSSSTTNRPTTVTSDDNQVTVRDSAGNVASTYNKEEMKEIYKSWHRCSKKVLLVPKRLKELLKISIRRSLMLLEDLKE